MSERETKTYTVTRNRAYWVQESQRIEAPSPEDAEDLFYNDFTDVKLTVNDVFVLDGHQHHDKPKALREGMGGILEIIEHLDALPEDHEPDLEILWDTIRSIKDIAKESQS